MRAPRYAQYLSVAALAAGFLVGGSARAGVRGAVESAPIAEPAPPDDEGSTEPETLDVDVGSGEPPSAGTPTAEAEKVDDPEHADAAVEGEGPPDAEGEADSATDAEGPIEAEPAEPEMITVRAGAASSRSSVGKPILEAPSSETVIDRRRRHADERILLRASAVSFGVAGAALVPMIVGLQQGAKARRQLDEESPSDAERASLESSERQMKSLALGGGIVAGVQLVTGAVLLGVFMQSKTPRRHALAPTLGRGQVGLQWRARF